MIRIFTLDSGEVPEYIQGVRLDGVDYGLRLAWNGRTDHWVLSLYLADADLTPLVTGRPVVLWTDLLRGAVTEGMPPGQLFAFPLDSQNVHPDLTGFARVSLSYRSINE